MQVQLTAAGAALLQGNTGPITLTVAKLGSGVNYTPEPSDTNIHGTLVFSTTPTAPVAVSPNLVRYSVLLDYDLPSMSFGELGLFTADGTLFALAVNSVLLQKIQLTSVSIGNSIRLDIYLSMVGTNYTMWLDLGSSSNSFQVATINSVDQLPTPQSATPNMYVVQGASAQQQSFFTYTDRNGLWNFDGYAYANTQQAVVTGSDFQSVTIALASYNTDMDPDYFGQIILEFMTGPLAGFCRYVQSAVISGGSVTLGFQTPIAIQPDVGDIFILFNRQSLSTSLITLPIATHSVLGAVIVGPSLTVASNGQIDVAPASYPVSSVNGLVGNVVLTASNITGFAAVATSGDYNDLINKPAVYALPVATTSVLGGVKAPSSNEHLAIASDGTIDLTYDPIKTINGVSPDPSSGALTLPIATTSALGIVSVGTGLAITGPGVLSATLLTVNGAAPVTGNVTIPVATGSVAGTVKSSSVISVAGDGTLGLSATVNGAAFVAGNAVVIGLVTPIQVPASSNLNTYQTCGLFYVLDANVASLTNAPSTLGGTLEIEPLTTTAGGGDVIQRYQTASQQYFRRYTQTLNTWSTWVAVATSASLPVATTSSLGTVQVGAGLNVSGGGLLSTKIQTINGFDGSITPFVVLAASDVGAIASSVIDQPGGVPSLNAAPGGSPNPLTDPYTYSRVPFYENTLGSWWNAGTWNASTNNVTLTGQVDATTGQLLLAGGQQTIDITYDHLAPNRGTYPNLQTVSAEGMVYRVTTAGTTSLDGIAQWNVGDLAVAIQGAWVRIPNPYVLPAATASVLGGVKKGTGLDVAAGVLSVTGVTNSVLTAASGYRENPDGTIEMWGTMSFPSGTNSVVITLPTAIPTGILTSSFADSGSSCYSYGIGPAIDSTHITVYAPVYWIDGTGAINLRASASGTWNLLVS